MWRYLSWIHTWSNLNTYRIYHYTLYIYMIIYIWLYILYIWLSNMCVCETKWLLAMFFSSVPSHCPHCRAGEVRVAGYTNEERLSCTALPWWIWCDGFFFGSVDVLWIILDILDHGFKMVQTKKKEHQYIQMTWEVLVMLNFFGSLIPGCGEYLNLSTSRTMCRDGHPREPNRTCRRPHVTQPLAEWKELLC